jgi:TonB-dependent starch-binding outer membrane protein SusC
MRITFCQLLCVSFMSAMAYAHTAPAQELLDRGVTLSLSKATLREALSQLANTTQVKFAYSRDVIRLSQPVDISARKEPLSSVLDKLLLPLHIEYRVVDDQILLSKSKRLAINTPRRLLGTHLSERVQPLDVTVTGTVTGADNNQPLPGVSVVVKGTSQGTTTNTSGVYQLTVPGPGSVLVFSFVGYLSREVTVGNRQQIDVSLDADIKALSEVVVVGYGTVKKSDITGSVSSVSSEELTAYPALGTVQALQGRAAGVQIQANNGEPGATLKVRIRGGTSINASSDPIYVVDGFVGGAIPPPEDIESLEVLKDASATAIYGSRGANGVIMITTKRGKSGKPRIDLNTSFSAQHEINRLDVLNPIQFVDYIKEARPNYVSPGASTDWQDQIFRTGGIQNHQLSISGGSDAVSYYLSGALYDQKGVILNSGFKRFSVTSNVEVKASEKLKIGLNLFAQRNEKQQAYTQEGSGGLTPGVIASALKFEPDQSIIDPQTGRFTVSRVNDPTDNPYAIATQLQNESVNDRIQGNLFAEYSILNSLKFRTTFGATTNSGRAGYFAPTTLNVGRTVGGNASVSGSKSTQLLNENYLTYSKTFGAIHDLSVMGGYSFQSSSSESWSGEGQSFITDAVSFWNLDGASVWQSPTSGLTEWQIESYYARVNYALLDRYLFTANIRRDGSSNFSRNHKWATFPSGAFAWKMSNEPFMQNNNLISQWKWRVSYGLTGNQAISPYQTLARFSNVFSVIDGVTVNAVRPTTVANNDLTWETTAQFDVGTDISLFKNRINLVLDYYRMVTRDLLFSVQLPQYSGYATQLQNIGSVENKGFEVTLSTRNTVGELKWNTDINFSTNRNKILSLPGGTELQYGAYPGHMVGLGSTHVLREGYPVGSFFGWIYDGVYQEGDSYIPGGGFEQAAGGEKFRDVDGKDAQGNLTGQPDGKLNSDDRVIVGNPNPDFIWGLNNELSYKGFDLNIFFQGSQGNDVLSYTLMELNLMSGINNATTAALNRWTPTNTNTDVPKAFAGRTRRVSTRWVYDGSYVRLKNLALGYNFPVTLTKKLGISKLRLYASAQNILTLTKYEGYDPEVNYASDGSTNSNRNQGLDYGSYPNAKSYTVGLNIGF